MQQVDGAKARLLGRFVRGVLESGEESFRMRFFGAEAAQ